MFRLIRRSLLALAVGLLSSIASAQDDAGDAVSQEDLDEAITPVPTIVTVTLHNYWRSPLMGLPDTSLHTSWVRFIFPIKRLLIEANLPINTLVTPGSVVSGLGDLNIFAPVIVTKPGKPLIFGVGPFVQFPTGTDHAISFGKWDVGGGAVWFYVNGPVMVGTLGIYQNSVGSLSWADDNPANQLLTIQPLYFFHIGSAFYLRGSPFWFTDFQNGTVEMPVGLGVGKVFKHGKTVFNLFVEPQYTFYAKGVGRANFQVFTGINLQFLADGTGRKNKAGADRRARVQQAMDSSRTIRGLRGSPTL